MGLIRCEIHGLTGIFACCEHIDAALDAARFERLLVLAEEGFLSMLCAACWETVPENRDPTIPYLVQLGIPFDPCCGRCLADWYAATGQGGLSAAITAARTDCSGRRTPH